jgi:hypothetical protein
MDAGTDRWSEGFFLLQVLFLSLFSAAGFSMSLDFMHSYIKKVQPPLFFLESKAGSKSKVTCSSLVLLPGRIQFVTCCPGSSRRSYSTIDMVLLDVPESSANWLWLSPRLV